MQASFIWLAISAGLFGLITGVAVPAITGWLKSKRVGSRLEIRLPSGSIITSNTSLTASEFEDLVSKIVVAEKGGDTERLDQVTRRERLLSDLVTKIGAGRHLSNEAQREDFRELLDADPLDRRAYILVGRYLAGVTGDVSRLTRLEEAMRILTEFESRKRAIGQLDHDYADVAYNLACYKALSSELVSDPKRRKELREAAIADLKESNTSSRQPMPRMRSQIRILVPYLMTTPFEK